MASKTTKDIRVTATSKIWLCATAMLAICIPLVAVAHSGGAIIPLVVIAGAAISTVGVWGGFSKRSINSSSIKSIQEMEQRIANLETICSSQELELHSKLKRLESKEHI